MKTSLLLSILAAALSAGSAVAQTPADAAFAKLAALSGTWSTSDESGQSAEVVFSVVSDGSAVLENSMGMITVYTQDNGTLMATHYCSIHNQPRMRAQVSGGDVKSLDFQFVDVTNAGPNDHFINHLNFDFVDQNHIVESWGYGTATTSLGTTQYKLSRKQ